MKKPEFVEVAVGSVTVKLKSDDRIAGHILSGKKFEPETLRMFADECALNKGMVFLDIGCYSGLFAIAAHKMGLHAIGFEPFPDNQNQIAFNAGANGALFDLRHYALSDKDGEARFGHTDVHLTSGGSLERKGSNGLQVTTRRLDSLVLPNDIAIIKMDVERHEPAVIRGARNTIASNMPVMIIECNDDDMVKAVNREMEGLGYAPAFVLDQRNYIFRPR